jgi:hypothetical protein
MRDVNYADGQAVRVGDTISYLLVDGIHTTAVITGIDPSGRIHYSHNGRLYSSNPRLMEMRLVTRASMPVKAGSGKYAQQGHVETEWATEFFQRQAQKEQDTMKKAYKAYIIEVDKDGNHVKMLHESIVFAVNKEKAEQAVIIQATQGGVVDSNTNFVVATAPLN